MNEATDGAESAGLAPARDLADVAERVRKRHAAVQIVGLRGAAGAIVAARLAAAHPAPVLVLAADSKRADVLQEDLRAALGEPPAEQGGRVRAFPRPDTAPYDRFSPQAFVTAQRMDVLYRLLASAEPPEGAEAAAPPVVVAPWTALAQRVPARSAVRARSLHVATGAEVERDALAAALALAGYLRQPLVEERGEFAVRGGIVDFFPPQRARPVRIELLGDDRRVDPRVRPGEPAVGGDPPARRRAAGARAALRPRARGRARRGAPRARRLAGHPGARDRPLDRHAPARRRAARLRSAPPAPPAGARGLLRLPARVGARPDRRVGGRPRAPAPLRDRGDREPRGRARRRPAGVRPGRELPARRSRRGGARAAPAGALRRARRRRRSGRSSRRRALRGPRGGARRARARAPPRAGRRRGRSRRSSRGSAPGPAKGCASSSPRPPCPARTASRGSSPSAAFSRRSRARRRATRGGPRTSPSRCASHSSRPASCCPPSASRS